MNKVKVIMVVTMLLNITWGVKAVTYTVDNLVNNASDNRTFLGAVTAANATPGLDVIEFNFTGTGPFVISMNAPITITESVIINGFTQSGAVPATATTKATLMIVLQGTTTPWANGLLISSATDVTILGITFNHFDYAVILDNSQLCKIAGCYVGMDYTGLVGDDLMPTMPEVYQNNYGIVIRNNSSDCIVGGATPGDRNVVNGNNYSGIELYGAGPNNKVLNNYSGVNADGNTLTNCYNSTGINVVSTDYVAIGDGTSSGRNVLSGNYNAGVMLNGSSHCTVIGNYIGTDPTGMLARPNVQGNQSGAVTITGGNYNTIGGAGAKGNVISGNNGPSSTAYGAVLIRGYNMGSDTYNNVVIGNYIGVAADGVTALPNIRGVYIDGTGFNNFIGNGSVAGQNIIAYSANEALVVDGSGTNTNKINLNAMYCNGSGITLKNSGNNLHMKPTIYAANDQRITGYAVAGDSVQLYIRDAGCAGAQGKVYLGRVEANASGIWEISTLSLSVAAGDYVVASGYNSQGVSSAFSTEIQVVACSPFAVNAGTDQNICVGTAATMTATLNAGESGKWTVHGNSAYTPTVVDITNPTTGVNDLNATGNIDMIWSVMNPTTYCEFTNQIRITVGNCGGGTTNGPEVEVYNMVSPNGDNIYDYLKINNAESYPGTHLTVVNRWGDLVFEMDKYNNTTNIFTGHANNGPDKGELLPDGTYFYRVTYENTKKEKVELSGYLELKR